MKNSIGYLLAPVIGFVLAQILKYVFASARTRSWRSLFRSGNMPSGHSASVTALASVVFFSEGFTGLFAVAATFAIITVYDALVARRSIGEQGEALIRLIEKSPFAKDPMPRVALGHKPLEVAVGIFLGATVGIAVAFLITK